MLLPEEIIITIITLVAFSSIGIYLFMPKQEKDEPYESSHYYTSSKKSAVEPEIEIEPEIEPEPEIETEEIEEPTQYIIAEGKNRVHKVSCVSGARIHNKVAVLEKDIHLYDKCKMCFR